MQASKKFYNKCSENSRSQFVFRTDIFRKLSLGAPEFAGEFESFAVLSTVEKYHNVRSPTYGPSELKFCKADKETFT